MRFAEKLKELLDFHNFVLTNYFKAAGGGLPKDARRGARARAAPHTAGADVPRALYHANRAGKNLLFEGAQGSLLDIDHGTYPFVTSSNCVAGAAAAGAGIGPHQLHYVLGITKAYTTRVGSGPFPTELTRRCRRATWRRAARSSARPPGARAAHRLVRRRGAEAFGRSSTASPDCASPSSTCSTASMRVKICVGYEIDGEMTDILPIGAEELERCEPVYEEMPGWKESTVGVKRHEALPKGARDYLARIEALTGVPIDLISTGPDRDETIVRRHPFD